jgi:RNA polymerase sigma factor
MDSVSAKEAKLDSVSREVFIKEHIPFVIYTVSSVTGRYISTENDMEYSVGLEALDNAIDAYDGTTSKFETFATTVIKNRVIDFLRKENRKGYQLSESDVMEAIIDESDSVDMRMEIAEFSEHLKAFGLTFDDLVDVSPKHVDSRKRAIRLGVGISEEENLMTYIYKELKLPVSNIVKLFKESRRFVYLNNKYILSIAIIFDKDYSIIKEWIGDVIRGDEYESK